MKPAAPVTRIRTPPSLMRLLVPASLVLVLPVRLGRRGQAALHRVERAANLGTLRLELLRALKWSLSLGALSELEQRVAEVVVREPFGRVGRPGTAKSLNGPLEQR